jgi:hypothetical protein
MQNEPLEVMWQGIGEYGRLWWQGVRSGLIASAGYLRRIYGSPGYDDIMRLWTLHPQYLDAQGLVALWREALLAQAILRGATKGYKNHPQLVRFRATHDPCAAICSYLEGVFLEANLRGYSFDFSKIPALRLSGLMNETQGQLFYEWHHLQRKLKGRALDRYTKGRRLKAPLPHPLFQIVAGGVQSWERVK